MATLVLRGDTWHLMWRWRGKLKSQSTKVPHDGKSKNGKPVPPVEARRALKKLENSLDQGKSYENQTLDQLLKLVEQDYENNGYDARCLKSRLDHLRDFFGNMRADQITEKDFIEYTSYRRKQDAANQTINHELEMLMKGLRMGKIHPLPLFKRLKTPPAREGFFDDAKIAAVTRHLPDYLRAPFLFGYYTGWRREEVFSLEWSQIDFAAGEIRLYDRTKNELHRVFPMPVVPKLRPLLEELWQQHEAWKHEGLLSPYVFTRYVRETKTVRRMVDFRKALDTACNAAGCPGMLFHDLRRSAARNLEMAGWPHSMVMFWMGHETDSMFRRYRIQSAADLEIVQHLLAMRKESHVLHIHNA